MHISPARRNERESRNVEMHCETCVDVEGEKKSRAAAMCTMHPSAIVFGPRCSLLASVFFASKPRESFNQAKQFPMSRMRNAHARCVCFLPSERSTVAMVSVILSRTFRFSHSSSRGLILRAVGFHYRRLMLRLALRDLLFRLLIAAPSEESV